MLNQLVWVMDATAVRENTKSIVVIVSRAVLCLGRFFGKVGVLLVLEE